MVILPKLLFWLIILLLTCDNIERKTRPDDTRNYLKFKEIVFSNYETVDGGKKEPIVDPSNNTITFINLNDDLLIFQVYFKENNIHDDRVSGGEGHFDRGCGTVYSGGGVVNYILRKNDDPSSVYGYDYDEYICCSLTAYGWLEFYPRVIDEGSYYEGEILKEITPGEYTLHITDGEEVEFYSVPIIITDTEQSGNNTDPISEENEIENFKF